MEDRQRLGGNLRAADHRLQDVTDPVAFFRFG
jgi:hypothetical protein